MTRGSAICAGPTLDDEVSAAARRRTRARRRRPPAGGARSRSSGPVPSSSTRMKASPSSVVSVSKRVPDGGILAVAHAQHLLAGGAPALDDVEVGGGEVEVARPGRADRERRARLAQHRRHDGRVHHHREGEPAGEAHPERAHARGRRAPRAGRAPASAATPRPASSRRSAAW